MATRLHLASIGAIALFLTLSGVGGQGFRAFMGCAAQAQTASPMVSPTVSAAPGSASPTTPGSHDPNYYAYATRYYLQYLSSREQAITNAKDPFYFFNYYQFYRERYAPASARNPQGPMPAWFATMPFRNARTQAFARFVQAASPSAVPDSRWAQPPQDVQRAAER